jgi:ketosteroid isomerase-like protein
MTISETAAVDAATTKTWYEEFYGRLDKFDPTLSHELLTDDTVLRMANHPAAKGREEVRGGMEHFQTTIGGMRHEFTNVVEDGDRAVLEAICHYTRLDGSTVDIPVATAIERRDGRVSSQRVYIDLAPLFDVAPLS